MKGFRDFLMRGNLLELAIAFIMGTAFASVVTTFTNIILSLISKIGGVPNFDNWAPAGLPVGRFLTALVAFIVIAAVIYFGIVKPVTAFRKQNKEAAPTELDVLTDIRDLLKQQTH